MTISISELQENCSPSIAELKLTSSFYNLFFEADKKDILFNTHRGVIIEITPELRIAIEENRLTDIPEELIETLKEMKFLVPVGYDELAEYLQRYENSKEQGGALTLKLFMATSCNLGCPYCYQSAPTKPGNVIKKEQLDSLLKWIEWECRESGITALHMEFYGGEPLLARLLMPSFMNRLNDVCRKYAIPVQYEIITNATLMDDTIIDLFVKNRVQMQITLDGDKEKHDQRRAWKTTGKGSFEQIFNNLEKICARGAGDLVRLRINVDQNNINDVEPLARKAHQLGIKSFMCGRIHFREKKTDYDANMISSEQFDENFDLEIFKILQPLGFADSPAPLESRDTCLYHWKKGFSVSPSLDLFKCDELIDNPEYCVGHIGVDGIPVYNQVEYEKAVSRKPTDFEHCSTCRYLPQCGSGCSIRALNGKGTPHLNFCEATYDSVKRKVTSYVRAEGQGLISDQSPSGCQNCNCSK